MKHIIEKVIAKARKSSCCYQVAAVALDKNGVILSIACNSHRFMGYGKSLHAEIAVLRKAGPRTRSMIICRVGNSGKLLPIHPCKACKKVLDKMKIKVYTVQQS